MSRRPLHQNALEAYQRGELRPLGRATTLRPESDYAQDLSKARHISDHLRFAIARDQWKWYAPIAKATGCAWEEVAAGYWEHWLERTKEGREWVRNLPRLRPDAATKREIERRKNWWRSLGWVCAVVGSR